MGLFFPEDPHFQHPLLAPAGAVPAECVRPAAKLFAVLHQIPLAHTGCWPLAAGVLDRIRAVCSLDLALAACPRRVVYPVPVSISDLYTDE